MMEPLFDMEKHGVDVQWRYVVPPANNLRVVITQRQDGAFANDAWGCGGHYYVSVETLANNVWTHRPGSTLGGYKGWEQAFHAARMVWLSLKS